MHLTKHLFLRILPITLLFGCEKPVQEEAAEPEQITGLRAEWKFVEKQDRDHHKAVADKVFDAVFDGKIDDLEQLSQDYRAGKKRLPSGEWEFDTFYGIFANYSDWNQRDPERYYETLEKTLQEWIEKYPKSPAAPISLAALYTDWAWHERSSRWASEVSEAQWQRFGELITKAFTTLDDHREVTKLDPYCHRTLLRISLGTGWPMSKVDAVFAEGVELAPDFWELYFGATYFQLPRWHGENHQQWHSWLENKLAQAPQIDDAMRDEIYARVVLSMFKVAYEEEDEPDIFQACGVDWDRVKRGAEQWMAAFPEASRVPSRSLMMSMHAGDFDHARSIVERMNYRYDGREWWGKEDPEFFAILAFLEEQEAESNENSSEAE